MMLQDKIDIFINKAQTKITELSLKVAEDLYEGYGDDTHAVLANELSDVISSLQSEQLDWSDYEIELALDYYNYKAELSDIALINYADIITRISDNGTVVDSGWIDAFNSLQSTVALNKQATDSSINDLQNQIDNIDLSGLLPQELLDDIDDLKKDSHTHPNKNVLDGLTQSHLDSIGLNNNHRLNSAIHVTSTQKNSWDAKPTQQQLTDGLGGKSDVNHTHEISDIEGLAEALEVIAPEKGDKGDKGDTPIFSVGTVEIGEELQIDVDVSIPESPILNFTIPVAEDGEDFKIDVYGNASDRLKSLYDGEALGFNYLGTDTGLLYIRKPFAEDGVTPIPATTTSGWYQVKFAGDSGWSPILGTQIVDDDTTVLKVVGWEGGTGNPPELGSDPNYPVYIGQHGLTYSLGEATNVKGSQGISGPPGKIMFPDQTDTFENRYLYDNEPRDFVFLDSVNGVVYRKLSDSVGDWSEGFRWRGDSGDKGDLGNTGESLEFLWDGTSLGIKKESETSYTFKDLKGEKGEKGDVGKGFSISKSFESVDDLDGSNLDIDSIVIINSSNPSDPDDGKIYYWDGSSFIYLYKISDGTTIKGDKGDKGEKGDKGDIGETGKSLQFIWSGTSLGVKTEDDLSYTYVELKGDKGDKGDDGDSLQFEWDGTSLGVKTSSDSEYVYVDLKGTSSGIEEAPEDGELYLRKNGAWEKFTPSVNISTYIHEQVSPSSTWNIEHNLGKYPSITIVDSANNMIMANVQYIDSNNVKLSFISDSIGKAYLN